MKYTIHLRRKWACEKEYPYQMLSYDVICQNDASIRETSQVLKKFADMSDGEFEFAITTENLLYGENFYENYKMVQFNDAN